ncbi:MAG: HAMP domain-containing protein [Rhodobacteraceae bacterium]|nr:HAMP domain-containing protein [Paracoccaceae bacterium]
MADWSISKRIGMMTMALLGVLVLIAGTGLFTALSISRSITDMAEVARKVRVSVEAAESMYRAAAAKSDFRFDPNSDAATRFNENLTAKSDAVDRISDLLSGDPELDPVLNDIRQDAVAYKNDFTEVGAWQSTRNDAVAAMMETGPAARRDLNQTVATMIFDGNQRGIQALGDARQEYLLGRIFAERFLLSNAQEDFEVADKHLAAAVSLVASAADSTEIEVRKGAIEGLGALFDRYRAAFSEAAFAIGERNAVRTRMEARANDLKTQLEGLINTLTARQLATRDRAVQTGRIAVAVLAGLALVSLVAGTIFARRTARSIAQGIDGSVATMTTLAGGDLDVDITGQDAPNELGDIARALVVFRDTALETRALEARNKAAEEEQRKAEEARAQRDKEVEAERQRKAEEARRETIVGLRDSLGGVVSAAAAGDFSHRIETAFDDPELGEMAGAINLLVDNVQTGVTETARVMKQVADGDLSDRMQGEFSGTFAELQSSVNGTMDNLSDLVREIAAQCTGLSHQAEAMTTQSGDLSRRAEQQAASLEESAAVMEEMLASAKSSAQGTQGASQTAATATAQVEEAGGVVNNAVDAMGDIRDASQRIGEIVTTIEGIAFQTNLLALNASVEAARAGSAGKGFAVVATEVRALAQRSSEASHDIKELIEETTEQVNRGVDLVERTGTTLQDIVSGVRGMAGVMEELSTTAREQAAGVEDATGAITQIDLITQKNAILADESRETAAQVKQQADSIEQMMARFRLTPANDAPSDHPTVGIAAE